MYIYGYFHHSTSNIASYMEYKKLLIEIFDLVIDNEAYMLFCGNANTVLICDIPDFTNQYRTYFSLTKNIISSNYHDIFVDEISQEFKLNHLNKISHIFEQISYLMAKKYPVQSTHLYFNMSGRFQNQIDITSSYEDLSKDLIGYVLSDELTLHVVIE